MVKPFGLSMPTFAALALVLTLAVSLAACDLQVAVDNSDIASKDCTTLKSQQADGQYLRDEVEKSGASPLKLIAGNNEDSWMGRVFVRLLIWRSGGEAEAEAHVAESFAREIQMLESEIAKRCN